MAEVDSLEIKIQSDAEKASQQIDRLVKKLDSVAKSLGSINTSAMSASIDKLTRKLSVINGKGFSDLNRSAKEAGGSVSKISETAKRVSKSLSEIQGKYSDLGKGFEIKGSTQQIQKQIDSLTNQLAKAKLAKEDFEASGKTNLGGYETAVKNVIKYTNQIESLKKQLEGIKTEKPQLNISIKGVENAKKYIIEYKKELIGFKSSIKSIMDSIGGISNAPKEIFAVPIKNLKQSIEELKQDFPQATNVISAFENELSNLESIYEKVSKKTVAPKLETGGAKSSKAVGEEVEVIYQKMYGDAEKAAQKTDSLGNRVEALKAKLKELSGQGLNFGDAKFDETYRKLNQASEELKKHKSNLEQTGNSSKSFSERMKNALANVSSQTSKTSGSMGKLASSIKNALRSAKQSSDGFGGFTKKIGLLYAKIYVLRRGFNALFGTVKKSMDYVETLNYFNAAFGQIAKKADLKSFKKMGYDSAEAYYNSFSERAEQLTQKMSGFKIEESGMAVSTGEKSLGIDPALLMQNQAMFGQMANSMGIASETAANLSSVFTRLGADIASLKNEDFQKVWQNMASGMTGMSRAVDKYGMNIREANLQQTLNNIGISTSISKLTQQEKVLLRTIVMLDSSRAAWGDLAKTMNQPANQLRLLQSNWSNLSRTIGNIFLPIVAKVLPYINAVTIMLQRFAEQIVKFFGFDKKFDWGGLGATGGADFDIDFGDAEDDTAGMADNMDKTAKKAKKAVDNLQGFDIINKLQDPNEGKDSDGAGGNGGKGLSGGDLSKLSGALDKLLSEYDKAWNKAFKGMENKANKLANKMQKALVDAWNKGNFSEFGKKVAVWINKGLAKIPWDKIKATVKKIARSIATFLNGFIKKLDWALIGKTFAEGLNTVIDGAYEFWTTFDWLTFGTSLATGVNSFIKNFDAKKFGKLLGAKLRGVIQFAFGFIKNLNFEELGKKFGDAINGFFEDMGKVRKNTGLTGWQELGQTISKSITGILDTINTALSSVKWEEVGKAIADFLTSIDWWGILGKLLTVLANTLYAVVKTAVSAIAENPAGMIKALTGAFALIFTAKKLIGGFGFLSNTFKSIIGSGITSGINKIPDSSIKNGISSKFGSLGSIMVSLEVLATSVSFAQSAWKDVFDQYDTTEIYNAAKEMGKSGNKLAEAATGWGAILSGKYSFGEWANGLGEWWEDQWSGDTAVKNTDYSVEEVKKHIDEFGKHYNPVTGKTTRDNEEYERKKKEYLKNLQKENPKLYKEYMKYEKTEEELSKSTKKLRNSFKMFGNDSSMASARIRTLKNEVRNGTLSLSAYKKIVNKSYKSNTEWVATLRDARLATKYTGGELNTFNGIGDKLKTTLNKVGVSTKNAKGATELLKRKLDDGTISFEDYRKICQGSYKSTDDLYKTLEKVAGKKVTAEAKAIVSGKKDVDELGNKISTIKDKNITVKATADTATATYKINDLTKGRTVKVTAVLGKTKDFAEKVRKALSGSNFKMSAAQIFPDANQIKKYFDGITKTKEWKNMIMFPPAGGRRIVVNEKTKTARIPKELDFGGLISTTYKLKGYNINLYAAGGFPEDGWFRANHGEIMGRFDNGKSVVANNQQITDGIAQAVAPAVYSAVKAAMNEQGNGGGSDKVIILDKSYKQITEGIIGEVNSMTKSRGKSPILGVN